MKGGFIITPLPATILNAPMLEPSTMAWLSNFARRLASFVQAWRGCERNKKIIHEQ